MLKNSKNISVKKFKIYCVKNSKKSVLKQISVKNTKNLC